MAKKTNSSKKFASQEVNLYKVNHIYYEDLEVFYVENTNASAEAYWAPYGEGGDAHYNEVVGTLEDCLKCVVSAYEDSFKGGNVIEAYLNSHPISIEPGVGYPHYAFWEMADEGLAAEELGGATAPVLKIESQGYRDIWAR